MKTSPPGTAWLVLAIAIAIVIAIAGGASAQGTGGNLPPLLPPAAPGTGGAGMASPGAPVAGRNSFTAEQARSRILAAGYADVADLRLDESGVWRGMAVRAGVLVNVTLDYQGSVTEAR
jgi:hypothetical protein